MSTQTKHCQCCGDGRLNISDKPFYRHQIHEIPKPQIEIIEYRLYSGKCLQCGETKNANKPANILQGVMSMLLMSHIVMLSAQCWKNTIAIKRAIWNYVFHRCYQQRSNSCSINAYAVSSSDKTNIQSAQFVMSTKHSTQ